MSENIKTIQSIERAIDILKCFEKKEEIGVTELSKQVHLHKSTTFNITSTLEHLGLLEKTKDNKKYKLGMELFRLGSFVNSNIRNIVRPYLGELSEQYLETVNLVARNDLNVIYIEKLESPHSMRIGTKEGQRLPLYCTAVGKAILSTMDENELHDILEGLYFEKHTEFTITDKEELMAQIEDIVKKGYAEDMQELEAGLTCVAAPIRNSTGRAQYAISVSGPTSRMSRKIREKIGESLVAITDGISKKLGYNAIR